METKDREGSASTPARESAAVARQWWQPEGKDKEKDGATCPAALPTQKVTLGTLLKVKEALWGDGDGHVVSLTGYRGLIVPHSNLPLRLPKSTEAPALSSMHTWTGLLGTPVYRHTLFQNRGKLSWERSQGSQGIMRSPESANWKIIQPPQGRRATRPNYLHTDSLSGAMSLPHPTS